MIAAVVVVCAGLVDALARSSSTRSATGSGCGCGCSTRGGVDEGGINSMGCPPGTTRTRFESPPNSGNFIYQCLPWKITRKPPRPSPNIAGPPYTCGCAPSGRIAEDPEAYWQAQRRSLWGY